MRSISSSLSRFRANISVARSADPRCSFAIFLSASPFFDFVQPELPGLCRRQAQADFLVAQGVDARILAAGKPRISPLVQLFQIGQTVHRQLLGIALTGSGQAFEASRNFPS